MTALPTNRVNAALIHMTVWTHLSWERWLSPVISVSARLSQEEHPEFKASLC